MAQRRLMKIRNAGFWLKDLPGYHLFLDFALPGDQFHPAGIYEPRIPATHTGTGQAIGAVDVPAHFPYTGRKRRCRMGIQRIAGRFRQQCCFTRRNGRSLAPDQLFSVPVHWFRIACRGG